MKKSNQHCICKVFFLYIKKDIIKYYLLSRRRSSQKADECDGDTNYIWSPWKGPQRSGRKTGGTGNQR